jgi:hypothetical protein
MIQRCENPNNRSYHHYGARGVRVCDRWHSFEDFLADMGERPPFKESIDRIDGNGDYEPGNCRWATRTEQNNNKSTNRWIEYCGKRMRFMEAVALSGLKRLTVHQRIKRGWSIEDALSRPLHRR